MHTINVDKTQELIKTSIAAVEANEVEKLLSDLQDKFEGLELLSMKALTSKLQKDYSFLNTAITLSKNGEFIIALLIQQYAVIAGVLHKTTDPVNIPDMEKFCSVLLRESIVILADMCKGEHDYKL